jgi:hypothetical protein
VSAAIRLQLRMPLDWDRIDTIREAVALCLRATYDDDELGSAISMVSAELLENAVKYGSSGAVVRISLEELADSVKVVVTNPVDRPCSHAGTLQQRLAWLSGFADPRKAYVAALEQAYHDASEGGLGLARIAHEGRCSVACDTSTEGQVTVSACYARAQEQRVAG